MVITLAVAILTYVTFHGIHRSVIVLVVFCPCALILVTPTAIMTAAGNMSKRGILVQDSGAVERMASVNTILIDKTGTLTTGDIICHRLKNTYSFIDFGTLDSLIASVKSRSEHPLGRVISASFDSARNVEGFEYISGRGVSGTVSGCRVVASNEALISERCPENLT